MDMLKRKLNHINCTIKVIEGRRRGEEKSK